MYNLKLYSVLVCSFLLIEITTFVWCLIFYLDEKQSYCLFSHIFYDEYSGLPFERLKKRINIFSSLLHFIFCFRFYCYPSQLCAKSSLQLSKGCLHSNYTPRFNFAISCSSSAFMRQKCFFSAYRNSYFIIMDGLIFV